MTIFQIQGLFFLCHNLKVAFCCCGSKTFQVETFLRYLLHVSDLTENFLFNIYSSVFPPRWTKSMC